MLVLLALIWGSSFMFIKIAVRELDPATLVFGRLTVAALVLGLVVLIANSRGETRADLRAYWPALLVVGLLNTAVPFWLLSWGETRIDSGLASIIQASVPIFNALLAYGFFREQRVTGGRLVGVDLGFVGVAVLVGAQPEAKVLGAPPPGANSRISPSGAGFASATKRLPDPSKARPRGVVRAVAKVLSVPSEVNSRIVSFPGSP